MSVMNEKELEVFVSKLHDKFNLLMLDEEGTPTAFLSTMTAEDFVGELTSVEVFDLNLFHKSDGKYFGSIAVVNEYSHSKGCSVSEVYDYSANPEMENLIDSTIEDHFIIEDLYYD